MLAGALFGAWILRLGLSAVIGAALAVEIASAGLLLRRADSRS
jgi:Mn2+/Fe2+ NRAMP family transporter